MIVGSSLTQAVRSKARPCVAARRGGLDVEVVQHLEMVGDESAGADDHARDGAAVGGVVPSSSITSRMSGPIHGSGVRPADCQAICQSVALGETESARRPPRRWTAVRPGTGHRRR